MCPYFVAAVEELLTQSSRFLHSCIGQASTSILISCMSQFDAWLLIYGRGKAKYVVASKTELLLFSSNVEKSQFSKKGF